MALGADRQDFGVDNELRVEITQQGTTRIVTLAGECDLAQHERFRTAIRDVLAARPECVVLDLSDLCFIDSTGIHAVIELNQTAQRDGLRLVICPGPRAVQRVFELCGLISQLPFVAPDQNGGRVA